MKTRRTRECKQIILIFTQYLQFEPGAIFEAGAEMTHPASDRRQKGARQTLPRWVRGLLDSDEPVSI